MAKEIYLETTFDLLIAQMSFKTEEELAVFMEGYEEKETPLGVTYFIKKETT